MDRFLGVDFGSPGRVWDTLMIPLSPYYKQLLLLLVFAFLVGVVSFFGSAAALLVDLLLLLSPGLGQMLLFLSVGSRIHSSELGNNADRF